MCGSWFVYARLRMLLRLPGCRDNALGFYLGECPSVAGAFVNDPVLRCCFCRPERRAGQAYASAPPIVEAPPRRFSVSEVLPSSANSFFAPTRLKKASVVAVSSSKHQGNPSREYWQSSCKHRISALVATRLNTNDLAQGEYQQCRRRRAQPYASTRSSDRSRTLGSLAPACS